MIDPLDLFFDHYYRQRPVNATFTGMHVYDTNLPDWSESGLASMDAEMRRIVALLDERYPSPATDAEFRNDVQLRDAELARGFCNIQLSEHASAHGPRGNPALWTGEAVFSIIALMIRDFSQLGDRLRVAIQRMQAIPEFLAQAREGIADRPLPAAWIAKAMKDCAGAELLFNLGIPQWISSGPHASIHDARALAASSNASGAFTKFAGWLRERASAPERAMSCGAAHYDLLLRRGHQCLRSRSDLLADARAHLNDERRILEEMASEVAGSWSAVQELLAADHPSSEDYLSTFEREWQTCRQTLVDADIVTWPEWPIVYDEFPPFTRDAAPHLYYLYYRSPAPLDPYYEHVYVVPPLPDGDPEAHLRAWNRSVIRLNHVLHHGGVGHHLQNWHAYHRTVSRVGKIAAVDCANRIGMFCGGTMAEGWACYATGLMGELGRLTPLELVAEQHSRVRQLARAVIDLSFHAGEMSFDDAVATFGSTTGVLPSVAHAEVVKCSMFPCTPVMYWLGTQGILDLRERVRERDKSEFSLKRFHDALLGYGSIPVPFVARMMETASAR
jgi:hypothetical protein